MRTIAVLALTTIAFTSSARAQCFNIDTGFVGTPPNKVYGAASGMSGVWNDVGFAPVAVALNDINGVPTCVTITATTLGGLPAGGAAPLIPISAPDDAALYNDFALVPAPVAVTSWAITGLAPATYDIYVYSLSPFAATNPTLVSCINFTATSGKTVCGTWDGTGTAPLGSAYVVDSAVLLAAPVCTTNTLTFDSSAFGTEPFACVSGIQIVQRGGGCPALYCTPGTSGLGCIPVLSFGGPNPPSAAVHSNGFVITADQLDGQKQGIFFYSVSGPKAVPWCGVAGSYLCVRAPIGRMSVGNTGGTPNACDGTLSVDWNAWITNRSGEVGEPWSAGDHVWLQCWYRDAIAPCSNVTSNMSEALHFVLEP